MAQPVSRAMQVALSESEVIVHCAAANVTVSAIERLPAGGVRLVCNSVAGAEIMRRKFKSKVVRAEQARQKHRPVTLLW